MSLNRFKMESLADKQEVKAAEEVAVPKKKKSSRKVKEETLLKAEKIKVEKSKIKLKGKKKK